MDAIFKLSGLVTDARGRAIHNLRVAVVEQDALIDDLLGVGMTDERGAFRISFTTKEFNQEPFEHETSPDIYLVLSAYRDGKFVAVDRQEFPGLAFADGVADLGLIKIQSWDEEPTILSHQNPTPGLKLNVVRLNIDHDLVRHCLEEVGPLVESLTGWPGLLESTSVEIEEDAVAFWAKTMGSFDLGLPDLAKRVLSHVVFKKALAAYAPHAKRIVVNGKEAVFSNLDGLKVILGHELVHRGQFLYEPGLLARYDAAVRELRPKLLDADLSIRGFLAWFLASPLQQLMKHMEGYAAHVQTDFLQTYYNCAMPLVHVGLLERMLAPVLPHLFKEMAEVKVKQYTEGRAWYRERQEGNLPARFSPE